MSFGHHRCAGDDLLPNIRASKSRACSNGCAPATRLTHSSPVIRAAFPCRPFKKPRHWPARHGGHFRLYDPAHDPAPIHEATAKSDEQLVIEEDTEPVGSTEFAYEADLRNYLSKNLSIIEPGLKLYQDEGITGVEFPVGGRFIDILAVDVKGALVVIELKVSRGYDRVVGQLMRYLAWIRKNQAEPGQQVRGVIVAREISEDLLLACSLLSGVQLFEYELSLKLKPVSTETST
jgi:hypothetical protein